MTTPEFYGPSSTSVVVDKGISGVRGNNVFVSQGEPNSNLSGDFVEGDLAIDISTSSPTYLFVYRYETRIVNENALTAWYLNLIDDSAQSIVRLIPNSASRNANTTFVQGQASVTVQIAIPAAFSNGGSLTESLDIQYSIVNNTTQSTDIQNPISSFFAVTNSTIVNNVATLELAFSAVELDSGLWIPLQGQKTIHLVITVV